MSDIGSAAPDASPRIEISLNRGQKEMMQDVACRRLEVDGAAVGLLLQVIGLSQSAGEQAMKNVETIESSDIRRPATASSSSTEMPSQAYGHIDSAAASNEARNLAQPSGDVFNGIISDNFRASDAPGPTQYYESDIGSAPDYRPQPVNQNAGVRPPNNPEVAAAAYAALEQIHGSMQRPVIERHPGVPLDQLDDEQRLYFERLESEYGGDGGANV